MFRASSAGGFRIVSGAGSPRVVIEEPACSPVGAPEDDGPGPDYEAGRRDAEATFARERAEWQRQVERWSAALPGQVAGYLEALERQARAEICELAVRVAAIILREALPGEALIRSALDDALGQVVPGEIVRIALHPEDAERIGACRPIGLSAAVEWSADPSLRPGDVVVHTERGLLDGRLAGRIEAVREMLREACAATGEPGDELDPADD